MGASGSGGGMGIRIRIQEGKNFLKWRKRKKFPVLKCWIFFLKSCRILLNM
jgi:hypothetical protein